MPFRPIVPPKDSVASSSSESREATVPEAAPFSSPRARKRPAAPANDPSPPPEKRKHHVVDRTGPNWDENGDYIVGKGRTPVATRWGKGQSGNSRGPRARKPADPETELDNAIINEFAAITNGEKTMTNLGIFAINVLKAKAAQKDRRAAEILLNLYRDRVAARRGISEDEISPEEQAMIDNLLKAAGHIELPPVRNAHVACEDEYGDEGYECDGDDDE